MQTWNKWWNFLVDYVEELLLLKLWKSWGHFWSFYYPGYFYVHSPAFCGLFDDLDRKCYGGCLETQSSRLWFTSALVQEKMLRTLKFHTTGIMKRRMEVEHFWEKHCPFGIVSPVLYLSGLILYIKPQVRRLIVELPIETRFGLRMAWNLLANDNQKEHSVSPTCLSFNSIS